MSPTLLGENRPLALKSHRCNACLGVIQPGEQYARQRVVDGGWVWVWKAHLLCLAIDNEIRRDAWYEDEGPAPEEIHDVLRSLLGGLLGRGQA